MYHPKFTPSAVLVGILTALSAYNTVFAESSSAVDVTETTADGRDIKQLKTLEVVAVRDQAETSFKADRSDTATRTGVSLQETPAAVTVITSKVLETQQTQTLMDALKNVSSISFEESPQGKPSFGIRGFADANSMINGLSSNAAAYSNVSNVERIEVLKGPQAILSGANGLGGSVNVVTKKPQAEPLNSVQLQYASHKDAAVTLDSTGALTKNDKLSYRVIASKAKADDSEGGFDGRDDQSVLAQLRWKDNYTDLITGFDYTEQFDPIPNYTTAVNGEIQPKPDYLLGSKEDGFDSEQKRFFYQLEQYLRPNISLISRMEYSRFELDRHNYNYSTYQSTAYFTGMRNITEDKSFTGDHYLRILADTGSISHKIAVGLNHSKIESDETTYEKSLDYPIDSLDSVTIPDARSDQTLSGLNDTTSKQFGFYLQDILSWGNANLSLNFRRTKYSTEGVNTAYYPWDPENPETTVTQKKEQWTSSPSVGLLYNINPQVAVYASYAQGFSPTLSNMCGGGLTDPIESSNKEVGAKFNLLDQRLSLTTAVFELKMSNTTSYDWQNDCYNLNNGQTSKGIELDLQGQLAKGWNISANYTYSRFSDHTDSERRFAGQPTQKFSLWSTYELQTEVLRGLGVGLGITAVNATEGEDNVDTSRGILAFETPGAAQVDLSLFYNKGPWNTTLGVKNLFDKEIYESSSNTYVRIKDGRTVLATVKYTF